MSASCATVRSIRMPPISAADNVVLPMAAHCLAAAPRRPMIAPYAISWRSGRGHVLSLLQRRRLAGGGSVARATCDKTPTTGRIAHRRFAEPCDHPGNSQAPRAVTAVTTAKFPIAIAQNRLRCLRSRMASRAGSMKPRTLIRRSAPWKLGSPTHNPLGPRAQHTSVSNYGDMWSSQQRSYSLGGPITAPVSHYGDGRV